MTQRSIVLVAAISAAALLLCGGTIGLPIMMFGQQQAEAAACGLLPAPAGSPAPGIAGWTSRQVTHAATIVSVGRQRDVPARGLVIALATAMQESRLRNLANASVPESLSLPHDGVGRDHDSVGLFQQRPGWGTVRQRMTPSYAAGRFYDVLVDVDGWERMRLTDAAQAVQRSGYPEAYQQWEDDAEQLAAHVLGLPNIDVIGGGDPYAPCGLDGLGPVPVGPGGWVQPIRAGIVSGFGQRAGRLHAGVDLSKANIRGDAIRAASSGVVERVRCDSSTGTCDRDGSPSVRGCGWYVDIRHPGNVVTRYCHMVQRPSVAVGQAVQAGQVIGFVGSSGHSSGPHLHYEVHLNVPPGQGHASSRNAVDPVPFHRHVGAPL